MNKNKEHGSLYIDEKLAKSSHVARMRSLSPVAAAISGFFAVLLMVVTIGPMVMGQFQQNTEAEAKWGMACSITMGSGMDHKSSWNKIFFEPPLADNTNRTWTLQEALSSGAGFVMYHGEGEAKDAIGVRAKEKPTVAEYTDHLQGENVAQRLESTRTLSTCWGNTFLAGVANGFLSLSNAATSITQFVATNAFNTNIICSSATPEDGSNCLNILKLVGGTGSRDGGIIGALTSSIYYPLLIIVVAVSGFWVLYIGFAQKKVRQALSGAIWIFAAVIVGLVMLLNPSILAKIPMATSNVVANCIMGAFNGDNCFDNSSGSAIDYSNGTTSENICESNVSGASMDEKMQLTTGAIGCQIWKAFILEPLAQGSFGTNFENLDTENGKISAAIEKAGFTSEDFCVNLGSTKSYNDMKGNVLRLDTDTNKVCNLLTYQMYLSVNAQSGSDGEPSKLAGVIDARWYKVVITAANDDGLWSYWSGGGLNKVGMALMSVLLSALGGFIIIVVSLFSLVYYVTSSFLMAFAPVFLLFGVHPGRGKKIFFGWVEQVISNILKYIIGAAFLVVTLAIYGQILSSADNLGMIILFVLIITMALFMYRNELTKLVGRVNMGGQQLSNAMSSKLRGIGDRGTGLAKGGLKTVGGLTASGVGSGIGAKIAGGDFKAGLGHGLQRDLSRRGGITGNVMRQVTRNSQDNRQDLRQSINNLRSQQEKYSNVAEGKNESFATNQHEFEKDVADHNVLEDKTKMLQNRVDNFKGAENRTLQDLRQGNEQRKQRQLDSVQNNNNLTDDQKEKRAEIIENKSERIELYFDWQDLANEIRDDSFELEVVRASGDLQQAEVISQRIQDNQNKANDIRDNVGADHIDDFQTKYLRQLDQNIKTDTSLNDFDPEELNTLNANKIELIDFNNVRQDRENSLREEELEKIEAEIKLAETTLESDLREKLDIDYQPGMLYTSDKMREFEEEKDAILANDSDINALRARADELRNMSQKNALPSQTDINAQDRQIDPNANTEPLSNRNPEPLSDRKPEPLSDRNPEPLPDRNPEPLPDTKGRSGSSANDASQPHIEVDRRPSDNRGERSGSGSLPTSIPDSNPQRVKASDLDKKELDQLINLSIRNAINEFSSNSKKDDYDLKRLQQIISDNNGDIPVAEFRRWEKRVAKKDTDPKVLNLRDQLRARAEMNENKPNINDRKKPDGK